MIYKYIPKFAKSCLIVYALVLGGLVCGVLSCIFYSVFLGIVLIAFALYIVFEIVKNQNKIKSAKLVTYTEGFTAYKTDGSTIQILWKDIDNIFEVTDGTQNGFLVFKYDEDSKLLKLPPRFLDFDLFKKEIESNCKIESIPEFIDTTLAKAES